MCIILPNSTLINKQVNLSRGQLSMSPVNVTNEAFFSYFGDLEKVHILKHRQFCIFSQLPPYLFTTDLTEQCRINNPVCLHGVYLDSSDLEISLLL